MHILKDEQLEQLQGGGPAIVTIGNISPSVGVNVSFINQLIGQFAIGGTAINGALQTALARQM